MTTNSTLVSFRLPVMWALLDSSLAQPSSVIAHPPQPSSASASEESATMKVVTRFIYPVAEDEVSADVDGNTNLQSSDQQPPGYMYMSDWFEPFGLLNCDIPLSHL